MKCEQNNLYNIKYPNHKKTGGISVSDADKEMKGRIKFEQNNLQSTKLPKSYKNMKQKEIENKDEQNNWQLHK